MTWGDLVELNFVGGMFRNDALVNFQMNLPTADKIKQPGATCLELV